MTDFMNFFRHISHSKSVTQFVSKATGVAILLGVVALCPFSGHGQPVLESVLYSFGNYPDGFSPQAGLVLAVNNTLYGVADQGGTATNNGTIFKLNPNGSGYATLHNFTNPPDGANPASALLLGNDGMLYGTTTAGGTNGLGIIFKINPNTADYQILYTFQNAPDGNSPTAGLLQATNGALYGTARLGGTKGQGTIFTIHTDGNGYQVLYSFTNNPDGATPQESLMQADDGALYGMTFTGGTGNHGTIFRIQPNGSGYQVLHAFTNTVDGNIPRGTLLQASDGLLYGATQLGGANNDGVAFQMTLDGANYTVLHSFASGADGSRPFGGLIQGLNTMLYGTTLLGGTNGSGGCLYRMQVGGSGYEVVYHFGGNNNAARPAGALLQGASLADTGVLYGTSTVGGAGDSGAVFAAVVNPPMTITPVVNQGGASGPVVFWPAFALNYVLQTTTNINTGPWVTVTNTVPLTGVQVTNLPDPSGAYFRLVWPK